MSDSNNQQVSPSARVRRTHQQQLEHYLVERELADRLRHADKQSRRYLYAEVYDELFRRVAHHPQLQRKQQDGRSENVAAQMRLLKPFLRPSATMAEIGAGDCALSFAAARYVRHVYAVDVSAEITRAAAAPANFTLILSDGTSLPLPPSSVQIVYSNQLMEHLHPDDAREQLHNIFATLAPGGCYLCVTPSRLSGPHDVSRFFDQVATCFHLREYTSAELAELFRSVGFRRVAVPLLVGSRVVLLPMLPVRAMEQALARLPYRLRHALGRRLPVRKFLGKVIAYK